MASSEMRGILSSPTGRNVDYGNRSSNARPDPPDEVQDHPGEDQSNDGVGHSSPHDRRRPRPEELPLRICSSYSTATFAQEAWDDSTRVRESFAYPVINITQLGAGSRTT